MPFNVSYQLSVGQWSVNSADDARTEFLALETLLAMNAPDDVCRVTLYAPPAPQPGLLEQAVGAAANALGFGGGETEAKAFSVQVRGNDIKHGDALTLELTCGNRSGKIITGEVQLVESSLDVLRLVGRTGSQKLANTRLNQTYENQSLNQIVRNLAQQAGVDTGQVENGRTYAYLVIHDAKTLWQHICELAQRDGFDVYFDEENRLSVQKFSKTSPEHTFYYGIDLLDLRLTNHDPTTAHVRVSGESPASNQGTTTWHWLVKDPSSFQSDAGDGDKLLALQDGALRTKDAAETLAKVKLGIIKDQSSKGKLKLVGYPQVRLGDAIEIKNAPKPELNGLFKVTSIRHVVSKQTGFVTYVGFTGSGGAQEAGDLLGQLAGELGL